MKNTKTFPIVMIPTEKESNLSLYKGEGNFPSQLKYSKNSYWNKDNFINQHLYILSDDEIKEGDFIFDSKSLPQDSPIKKVDAIDSTHLTVLGCSTRFLKDYFKKIVATTDKSLFIRYESDDKTWANSKLLPQLPESFINKFIKSYNDGKIITEVDLEMEEVIGRKSKSKDDSYFIVKTREDNTVIVHESRKYSRDEVEDIIQRFDVWKCKTLSTPELNKKWISENLK